MRKVIAILIFTSLLAVRGASSAAAQEQHAKKPFTVADDIGFTHFVPDRGIAYSPSGEFFVVLTSRGRLDVDRVEESLRFYRTRDVEAFLRHPEGTAPPEPVWVMSRLGKKEPIVKFQWLGDSSGVALLERTEGVSDRIVLADLRKKTTEVLPGEVARYGNTNFAISDRNHYVYVADDEAARKELEQKRDAERRAPMISTAGRNWWDLVLPDLPGVQESSLFSTRKLKAAVEGKSFEIKHDGAPLSDSNFDFSSLALSPDGQTLVTRFRVKNLPQSWEQLYPPPYPSNPYNDIHVGGSVSELVRLDLKNGILGPLTDAPVSGDAGWTGDDTNVNWSGDGQAVVLSGTFIQTKDGTPSRPCVAVVDFAAKTRTCVEKLKGRKGPGLENEEGYHYILSARFAGGDKNQVELAFMDREESVGTVEYRRTNKGDWQVIREVKGFHNAGRNGFEIFVKEGLDEPPTLIASNQETSQMIWDPNPQFRQIELGPVKVYRWKDKNGRDWSGGLYMPPSYKSGEHYPFVIQTHGFNDSVFLPSGSYYPTAFAARELAGAGIVVLQTGGDKQCGSLKTEEASCEVAGFEAAAAQLAAEGIIDLQAVGYIGFSRTCWYGMEMLTNGSLRLRAAVLSDGIMADYLQFLLFGVDFHDYIGAKPVGEGLQTWLKRSPGFNLEKVNAPLLLNSERNNLLEMWQPYAGLRYLNKPVELMMVNTDEHVLTNPVERQASQGLTVDWFRFWMQGYEDPDPAKVEQYKRWRELRKMQDESNKAK